MTEDLRELKLYLSHHKRILYACLGFFVLFWIFYNSLGNVFLQSNYTQIDYFGMDHWKPGWHWTHLGSKWGLFDGVRPLLPIFLKPFSLLFNILLGDREKAVILVNSMLGSFTVSVSFFFFWIFTKNYVHTFLLTSFFGLTFSQLIFGSIPESREVVAWTIIFNYIVLLVSLNQRRIFYELWVIAGVLCFGLTITNFPQTIACFATTVILFVKKRRLSTLIEYAGVVIFLVTILQIIEIPIIGGEFFFMSSSVENQAKFFTSFDLIIKQPIALIWELFKNFFIFNFVGSYPLLGNQPIAQSGRLAVHYFWASLNYSVIGWTAIALWVIYAGSGIYKNLASLSKNIFLYPVIFSIIFNLALHSIFGNRELFLYNCHFTFIVFLLSINLSLMKNKFYQILLLLLTCLMGLNNLQMINYITLLRYN